MQSALNQIPVTMPRDVGALGFDTKLWGWPRHDWLVVCIRRTCRASSRATQEVQLIRGAGQQVWNQLMMRANIAIAVLLSLMAPSVQAGYICWIDKVVKSKSGIEVVFGSDFRP